MPEETNFKDLILRTFQKKKIERIVWQPRLMLWYNRNKVANLTIEEWEKDEDLKQHVPKEYIGKSIIDIHKDIDSSIRYTPETMSINYFYSQRNPKAEIKRKFTRVEGGWTLEEIETPIGKVRQRKKEGFALEKFVKNLEDLKIIKYIVENEDLYYNDFMFEAAVEELGNMGVPQCYFFRSPYQRCVLDYLGFEKTTIFLKRYPREMEDFLQFLDEMDRKLYKVILNSNLQILNFGENIDCNLSPPRVFEKYLIPYYKERVKWCKNAPVPKFTHIHIDGHVKDLLPYLEDLPFDGIEALTPEPQGDVTLEELKKYIGDKIILDGIPANLFMPYFPVERLIETTKKILNYFSPNLIIGVSDELPPNTDARRLKLVGKIVRDYQIGE